MNVSDKRTLLARKLLTLVNQSAMSKHGAFLLAGWADLFGLLPRVTTCRTVPLKIQLLGYCLLVVWLIWLAGPMLNAMQPALKSLGQVSGSLLLSLIFAGFNIRRYFVGRRVLLTLARMH